MSKKRPGKPRPSRKPEQTQSTPPRRKAQQTRRARWPQVAILSAVALVIAVILIVKNRPAEPAVADGEPQVTATLPEAVGQTEATAELKSFSSQVTATAPAVQGSAPVAQEAAPAVQVAALPGELPEAQLERLIIAGQPTLAFFHSNNCVQCIKMMEVVEQVYPEFDDAVALVDVNVYDKANSRLLQRAQIRAIPTQIFFDRNGQGQVIMGAMTPDQFREQMQTLAGGE